MALTPNESRTDLFPYRKDIYFVRGDGAGKTEVVHSGWQVVGHSELGEGFEPVDTLFGKTSALREKQVMGFELIDYGFSDCTGGQVSLPDTGN